MKNSEMKLALKCRKAAIFECIKKCCIYECIERLYSRSYFYKKNGLELVIKCMKAAALHRVALWPLAIFL